MPAGQGLDALVVGGVDSGEADRVVHLLTAEGRLAVFAPSAKRSKKRFAGALEPFTTISAVLAAQRRKAGMPTLSDATVVRARIRLRRGLDTIALASYFAELGLRTAPEGQTSAVATLVEAGWDLLLDHPATRRARRAFELRLMCELGYHPDLERCVACGVPPSTPHLDLVRGGTLCPIHRGAAVEIGPKTLAWLRAVTNAQTLEPEAGFDDVWAETAATKATGPLSAFWSSLLSRPLNASALLASVDL